MSMQIAHHVLLPSNKEKKAEVAYWTTSLICLVFTSQIKFCYYDTINFDKIYIYIYLKKATKIDSIIKIHWKGTMEYCIINKFMGEICIWMNDSKFRNSF